MPRRRRSGFSKLDPDSIPTHELDELRFSRSNSSQGVLGFQ